MAAMFLFFIVGCASIAWAFAKKAAKTTRNVAVGTVTKATPKVKQAARTAGYVAVGTAVKAAPKVAPTVAKGKAQVGAFKAMIKAAREAYNNAQ